MSGNGLVKPNTTHVTGTGALFPIASILGEVRERNTFAPAVSRLVPAERVAILRTWEQEAQTARSLPLRDHAEQWVFSLRRSDGGRPAAAPILGGDRLARGAAAATAASAD
jgi:hypothetical protein